MVASVLHSCCSVPATILCSRVLYIFIDRQTRKGEVTLFTLGTSEGGWQGSPPGTPDRRVVGLTHWECLQGQTFVGLAHAVPGGYPEPDLQAS